MKRIQALILDTSHQVLVRSLGGQYEVPMENVSRLEDYKKLMGEKGIALGSPAGVSPPQYVFVVLHHPAPHGFHWLSLGEAVRVLPQYACWEVYTQLLLGGYVPPSKDLDVFHFGNSTEMASRLAHLVIKGRKRATSGNPAVFEKLNLPLPTPGLVSIVTDGFGIPLCAIQTSQVKTHAFSRVPADVAIEEGEGDLSLEDWRHSHWEFFTKEAQSLGLTFDENSDIFTEYFSLLKVFGLCL